MEAMTDLMASLDAGVPVITVRITPSEEAEILKAMNEIPFRVVVRLLEEPSDNGCAWLGSVVGFENPPQSWEKGE
jgi:hypothetical protein